MTVLVVVTLVGAALLGVSAAVGRSPRVPEFVLVAIVEVGLLVQAAVTVVGLVRGDNTGPAAIIVVYLLMLVLALPLAALWALGEPTRWSTAVLAVGCLVTCVLLLRLEQVWSGA